MSTFKLTHLLLGVATATFLALVSCSLAPGRCLHMSDCDQGTVCVEGSCTGGGAPDELVSSTTSPGVTGDPVDARSGAAISADAGRDGQAVGDGQAVDDGGEEDDGAVTEPTSDL